MVKYLSHTFGAIFGLMVIYGFIKGDNYSIIGLNIVIANSFHILGCVVKI